MPELPEVETTVRGLKKEILGLKILNVWTDLNTKDKRKADTVANPKYFKYFQKEVVGKKILSVERRAKNILINLSQSKTILVHLKMTGYLFVGKYTSPLQLRFPPLSMPTAWRGVGGEDSSILPKYTHVVFVLSKNKFLVFSDARKFGKMTLLDTKVAHDSRHLNTLGPEPLDKNFTFPKFLTRFEKFKKSSRPIKTVLLDQSVVVGIGNIYSDEILWLAGIHPTRKLSKITKAEFQKIFKAMKKTLTKGIDFGGDSMSDYKNIYGEKGNFQMHHHAYRRTGEKCQKKNCPGIIKRLALGSRSAHFCPMHQN